MYQAANTKSTLKIKPHSWQVIQAGKSSCSWRPHWGPCEQLLMGTPRLGSLSNCSKERTVSCTQMFLKLSKRYQQHTQCVWGGYWGGSQNHNGFKLDLASEYGISRSQLAWIIASNNDYMIIKKRTKLKRRRLGTYILPRGGSK